ncbi:MAG: hypothetical protein HUN05_03505 [Desulfobacter sp.]|nr:MAG: hypothetical protein HUN05_03505 [Desulfobacter sp.]
MSALPALAWTPLKPAAPIKRRPLAMTIDQAKTSLGFSLQRTQDDLNTKGIKIKFAIIDTGFEGLDPWLDTHPEEKKYTHYISVTRSGKKIPGNHGYYAYRVARKILPHAHLYLLDKGHTDKDLALALNTMVKNKVFMGSFSQGSSVYFGQPETDFKTNKHKLIKMLNHYEITLFQAVGNDRSKVHFFPYQDLNRDKVLEFLPRAKTRADRNRIILFEQHELTLELFWNEFPKKKSDLIVQLVDKTGRLITQADSLDSKIPRIRLTYLPREKQLADIKLIAQKVVNPENLKFSLYVNQTNLEKGFFNGFERTAALSKFESPFLISVGSYGRDKNQPAPSYFSSHGQTVDGDVIPHILGPGQLKLAEKKIIMAPRIPPRF